MKRSCVIKGWACKSELVSVMFTGESARGEARRGGEKADKMWTPRWGVFFSADRRQNTPKHTALTETRDSRELEITPSSLRTAGQQIQHTHWVRNAEFGGVWRVTAATGSLGALSILRSSEEECSLISSKLSRI